MDLVLLFSFTISYILMYLNPFLMLYSFSYRGQWVCYVVTSFLIIHWSSTTVKESPQVLALSLPPMFMSRQVPTICNVWFKKISSKRSFSKKPTILANAKLDTVVKLQLARNNNHLLGVDLKLSCYFVNDHAFLSLYQLFLLWAWLQTLGCNPNCNKFKPSKHCRTFWVLCRAWTKPPCVWFTQKNFSWWCVTLWSIQASSLEPSTQHCSKH